MADLPGCNKNGPLGCLQFSAYGDQRTFDHRTAGRQGWRNTDFAADRPFDAEQSLYVSGTAAQRGAAGDDSRPLGRAYMDSAGMGSVIGYFVSSQKQGHKL